MEKVKNALEKKVQNVKKVNIQGINERTEIMKVKDWTVSGICVTQHYCFFKRFVAGQDALKRAFNMI